jgi:putative phosphoesterase
MRLSPLRWRDKPTAARAQMVTSCPAIVPNYPEHLEIASNATVIGVISDTHVPHRIPELPAAAFEALRGCDLILHAGDMEDPAVLRQLARIAPTYGVRGNLHWTFSTGTHDQDLPLTLTVRLARHVIWMTHGHFRFAYSVVDKITGYTSRRKLDGVNDQLIARLRRLRPRDASIVIYGHSHRSTAREHDGALFFNPGSVAAQPKHSGEGARIGRLTLSPGGVRHTWTDL